MHFGIYSLLPYFQENIFETFSIVQSMGINLTSDTRMFFHSDVIKDMIYFLFLKKYQILNLG